MKCTISNTKNFKRTDLENLFYSNDWELDIDISVVQKGLENSTIVISAWDADVLLGIIRCMHDLSWSATIDCLLVHKSYQGQGIGSVLIKSLLEEIKTIKYISVSPDEVCNNNFYTKFGFAISANSCLLQIVNSESGSNNV